MVFIVFSGLNAGVEERYFYNLLQQWMLYHRYPSLGKMVFMDILMMK